jgi:translocation and assembly module TamB
MRRAVLVLLALLISLPTLAQSGITIGGEAPWARLVRPLLAGQIPGLRLEGLTGTLTRDPRAARITLADDAGPWLVLTDVALVIDRLALLRGRARLERVSAASGELLRLPAATSGPQSADTAAGVLPSLPRLPLDVRIERLEVGRFEVAEAVAGRAAVLSLAGQLALEGGRLSADLALDRRDAPGSLRAELALDPAADRLRAVVTLEEPSGGLIASAAGVPDEAARLALRLDGPASGARLDLEAALGSELAVTLGGTVAARADGSAETTLEGEARLAPLLPEAARPLLTPLRFVLAGNLSAERLLDLRELRLAAPAGEAAMSGRVYLAAERLALDWRLSLPASTAFGGLVPDVVGWQSLTAEGRAEGAIAAPRVTARALPEGFASSQPQLAALLGPAPRVALVAAAPDRIERLLVEGAAARLEASGRVASPLDLRAVLALPDLAALGAGLAGALRVEATAAGAAADPTLTLRAEGEGLRAAGQSIEAPRLEARIATPLSAPAVEARLTASYAGQPVSLDVVGTPEGNRLRLERAEARLATARLTAEGLLDPAAALFLGRAELDAPDLAPLGRLAGQDLAGRLRATADLTEQDGRQAFDLRLDAPALRAGGQEARLRGTARGSVADAAFTLDGRAGPAAFDLAGRQRETGEGRLIELSALNLQALGERLRLAAPARAVLRPDGGVAIQSFAVAPGRGGRLDLAGRVGPDRLDATLTLANLPVPLLLALAGQEAAAQGALGGTIRATGPLAAPDWRAELRATGLRSTAPWGGRLPPAEIRLDGTGTGSARAELRATAIAGSALRLTANARLPQGVSASAPIAATLDGAGDIAPLAAPFLAGGPNRVSGRVNLALRVEGRLDAPRLGGEATLAGGSFRNADQGVQLTGIAARLVGDGERLVLQRLNATTPGGGTLLAEGTLSPAAPGFPVDIAVTARNARPIQSDLGTALLDADLRVAGSVTADARVSGSVLVRRADIRVPEQLPTDVRTIPDVRERGRGAPPPVAARRAPSGGTGLPPIALDVAVRAPRAVFVRGRGLDAELGGELTLAGTLAEPNPSGAFTLRRGTLDIADRQISFRRGTVTFDAGTFTPSLDLLAESRVRGATLQVIVEGSAADPRIRFASTPDLPQDEILARLLFDRSLRELSPFQIASIAQAAAGAVGLQTGLGTGGILDRLRRTLALDRLAVGSTGPDETATAGSTGLGTTTLEGGRYVAEGVYLGIRQGVTGGPPRVGVQIDVLPRIRLEAETAGNSRAGDRVGVTFEYEY